MDDLIRHPLTYARIARGWSLEDLARRIRDAALRRGLRSGVDRQRIWKWENNRATPDADSQLLLADVFEIDQSLIDTRSWPNWLPGRESSIPLGPHSTVPALREALRTSMDRRTFLTHSTGALAALSHQWATTEPEVLTAALDGKPVDAELLDLLETTATKLTSLVTEQRQYTGRLLEAHLTTVTELIDGRNYTPSVGQRLNTLAARLALTLGWYRFDQGKHASAGNYWHGALHSAHASGDRDLGAGILSDFAYQATWLNQPHTAATILSKALTRTDHPTARCSTCASPARKQHLESLAHATSPSRKPSGHWRPLLTSHHHSGVRGCRPPTSWWTPGNACSTWARPRERTN
ncbi:helix-turn-helix transcriptional regulator [Streptomyces sp. Edi2]|uniref:helix-turn-helix transcriptional regulator n=1 Tax=Streptomyces sp. Edi2 TaxID=3162528 RepID=UPI00330658C3